MAHHGGDVCELVVFCFPQAFQTVFFVLAGNHLALDILTAIDGHDHQLFDKLLW
jgi:hypothetical protein